jgi:hypothetical protein
MPPYDAYKGMEKICNRDIFDPVKFGTWKDVPILCQALRGSRNVLKRRPTEQATAAAVEEVEADEENTYVFADDD